MKNNNKNHKQLTVELNPKLIKEFKLFCVANEIKMKEVIEKAIKKELGIHEER